MMTLSTARLLAASMALATLAGGGAVYAIQPASWVHTNEADFTPGETEDAVVTNLGDVKLSTGTEQIGEAPEEVTSFNDLQAIGGTIYIAAGPKGAILKREGDKVEQVLALDNEQVFALDARNDQLLVAVSAEGKSRLAVLEGAELKTIAELPDVRYVWDLVVTGDAIVAATGTDGKVIRVEPTDDPAKPTITDLLDATQANILCLAIDNQGRIHAGSDSDGLVYRLTPKDDGSYEQFVLYDAAEPEIGALFVSDDGLVYAGTADAEQARPGRLGEAASAETGRPDATAVPTPPAEGEEPAPPAPGDLPQVPPGAEPMTPPEAPAETGEGLPPADEAQPAAPAAEPAPAEPAAPPQAEAAPPPTDPEPAPAEAAAPTPEQFDKLRQVIRQRLDAARRSGKLQVGVQGRPGGRASTPAGAARSRPATPQPTPQEGNAVYRIDSQGFVTEVFRESSMILKIVRAPAPGGDRLLVATGNEGELYSVDPSAEETTTLADLEPEQVTSILVGPDGGLMLGTANPARLLTLADGVAARGTYTSPVLDATQISLWGTLDVTATVPEGTRVAVETRSGNAQDPEQAAWSPWTAPEAVEPQPGLPVLTPRELKVTAPPARFLQYRLTLEGSNNTSPVVDRVEVTYVTPNIKPRIASLKASYPETPPNPQPNAPDTGPATNLVVEWEAADPNNDPLLYKLEYQPSNSDQWLLIAEDLTDPRYEWQTRRVPDGRYLVRLTADDRKANPGDMAMQATRRSDPVLVDNTAPELQDVEVTVDRRDATLKGTARDALSQVRSIDYVLDSEEEYKPILPDDLIFDSTGEAWSVTLSRLSPGSHVVTLRVTDTRGNSRYQPVLLEIQR